jgi:hypothetical protein
MTSIAETICTNTLTGLNHSPSEFGFLGGGWLPLVALALASSVSILALIYMAASMLRHQQALAWSKFEIFQIFATAVIVAFTLFIIFGMCNFKMGFLSASYGELNMYDIIAEYFSKLEVLGGLVYYYMMYITKIFSFLGRVTLMSNPLGVGSVENPLESVGQINSIMFYLLSGYLISFLLINLQARMLDYLAIACIFYLFPFGVFFRCFEPSRKFGGTLIGISIAMFLFYPIIIVFNDFILKDEVTMAVQALESGGGPLGTGNQAVLNNQLPGDDPNNMAMHAERLGTGGPEFESAVAGIALAPFAILRPLMVYFIGAAVFPVLNFIVLIGITRTLTHLLGEEIDVTNLTRLI